MDQKQSDWRREIGELLYNERKRRNLTQVHMACSIGVSEVAYRRAEEGRKDISRSYLAYILERMGLDGHLALQSGPYRN